MVPLNILKMHSSMVALNICKMTNLIQGQFIFLYYYEREWLLFRLQNGTCEKTYDKTIPKPTKASGIRWIDHRWKPWRFSSKTIMLALAILINVILPIPKPSNE